MDHSGLVEKDTGQQAGEETADGSAVDGTRNEGLCHYSVMGPNGASPPTLPPGAQCCSCHPGVVALAQLPYPWHFPGQL